MRTEKPIEAFERLRQSFDVIKANHSDAWSWHQYLENEKPPVTDATAEEEEEEEDDDPEMLSLKPKPRRTVDRLKSHLLACVAELNRASQAADLCYFHMCSEPKEMKPCCTVLGTSGDIDEELLEAAGDASPEKIMAALQDRLNKSHDRVKELEDEVEDLKDKLTDANAASQDRWLKWQNSRMEAEEAMTRLDATTRGLHAALERETQLELAYDDLYMRMVRASRMMKYKGRQMLRDKIFKTNKKEQIFYTFHGFIDVLKAEKDERIRLEREQQRDTVEFALGNEVRFLLAELGRSGDSVGRLTLEAGRLKRQRRELACRLLTKHRPREVLEYYLWIWELWQPLRPFLVCEKRLEREAAASDALANQLEQAWSQVPPLTKEIDELRFGLSEEQVAHHLTRKQLTQEGARQLCVLAGRLQAQRAEELQAPSSTSTTFTITTSTTEASTTTAAPTSTVITSTASGGGIRCPPLEENVDYMSDMQVGQLEGVPSPGACRERCDAEPRCDAWAWGDIRDVPGLTDFCFLKALEISELRRMHRLGVISGLSCSSFKAAGGGDNLKFVAEDDAARPDSAETVHKAVIAPASSQVDCLAQEEDVEYGTGEIMAEVEVTSAAMCREACEDFKGCGAWTWGAVRDLPGLTDMCFVKGAVGPALAGQARQGVVSGWPCSRTGSTTTPFPSTAASKPTQARSTSSTTSDAPTTSTTTTFTITTSTTPTRTGTTTTELSTTRTSHTGTSVTTTAEAPTLFCWCLCMPTGYEPSLIRFQKTRNSSIFGCEESAVYSSSVFEVAPGVKTLKVDSDLKAVMGGEFWTALNTWVFLKVWDRVIDDATYADYGWTVKVDPDAVFFPGRLRDSLARHGELEEPGGVYINNCRYGLHGPIEVFSANAVRAFAKDRFKCVEHIDHGCDGGPCEWGEDLFLDECLEKVLHVRRDDIMDLMIEKACDPPGGTVDCKNHSAAVYHPFKSVEGWADCQSEAQR